MGKKEILNIVDENDNIIGQEQRERVHKSGLLHREIHVWVYNDKGEVLLQKRAMDKDTFPGLFDASVGGHVDLNQTYEEAATRELEEEIGVKADIKDLSYLIKMRDKDYDQSTGMTNNRFWVVYAYKYNENKDNLRLEKGKAISLEFWPINRIMNASAEDREKFIPFLLGDKYSIIFQEIKNLIKQ
ncbi:MAG: NUDIX domain-containing protein [Patescibacteria group bacterium]|nr:NUDIX domain-containing protein [Patescibacteria group bacterium]MDD5121594.1 NUDIX domain-containing protein [Patescibacteria group bacterium]MDD5222227.1 NUDIX domain-containing protein [Patescibacteria group bacterium]MDD5396242.1 NUDIX domain-containing protein [Patescibacteria group bacterium]